MTTPRSRPQAAAPSSDPAADRAALALWLALIVLTAARAALAFVPSMWGWGLDLLRFISPIPGWTLWVVATLALVPGLARRALPALDALGRALDRSAALAYGAWGAGAAALAWAFPDRLRLVGDFLLRFGTAEHALKPSALFPQALPLDVLLHYRLARLLDGSLGMDVNTSARLLGALEAASLGVLAVAFARALALRGATSLAASAVVLFGGYLGMFTGYGKAIAEVSLLTAAFAVFGLRLIRSGGGLLPLGVCAAIGLTLHRSTLGLLPALALCWALALRGPDAPARWSQPASWLAAALPLAALAVMLPRITATFAAMDSVHFTPPEVRRQGGILGAMFAGPRPADLLAVVALLSPLALAAPGVAAALGRRRAPWREGALLLALALPWLAMLLLIHPSQGMFRDWDDLAAAAVSFSLVTAWLVATVVRVAPAWAWLCVPVALGVAVPSVQWLMHNADLGRGLARVEAYLREPPARLEGERAKIWDFLGIRYAQLDRWDRSAAAMAQAAELAPSPRILLQWASAEQARGNDPGAQAAYRRLLAIAPDEARGWYGLAYVSWRLADWTECRRAARELLRLRPGDPQARQILEQVDRRDSTRVEAAR
jgi:tetratricopeptide (TPR) repeat protein